MEELKEIGKKVQEFDRNKGYDRRKKRYKDAEAQIKTLENQAKSIILKRATERLAKLGFTVKDSYIVFDTGFSVYINPVFYQSSYRDSELRAYWSLQESRSQYSRPFFEEKDSDEVLKTLIYDKHREYLEAKKIRNVNSDNAKAFYKEVKEEVTYKDYCMRCDDEEDWSGSKVQSKKVSQDKNDWQKYSEIETQFTESKFEVEAKIRTSFKTKEEALTFWREFQAFVDKHTSYKLERRE